MSYAEIEDTEAAGKPPLELSLHWRAQTYGVLPRDGGLDDQPAGLLDRMTAAGNAYSAWKSMTNANKKATWSKENPGAWKVCQYIMKLQKEG